MRKPPKTDPQFSRRCDCGHQKNAHSPNGAACGIAGCPCLVWHMQLSFVTTRREVAPGTVRDGYHQPLASWAARMPHGGRAK